MKKFVVSILSLGLLCGCAAKKPSADLQKEVLAYMNDKYNEEFVIQEINYKSERTHDPVIPIPGVLDSQSNSFYAELKAKNNQQKTEKIRVDYEAETDTFSDNYQYDEIQKSLIHSIYVNELDKITQVSSYPLNDVFITPTSQTVKEYYHFEKDSLSYAYQYIQEHDINIYFENSSYIEVVCNQAEANQVISSLDNIFIHLFKKSQIQARFYSLDEYKKSSQNNAHYYLIVHYLEGKRKNDNYD